jgi:hypothetical protein
MASFLDVVAGADAIAAAPFQSVFGAVFNLGLFNARNIGPFVADVTISERHHDEMIITEHPIEVGSVIADHAYKKPIRVIIAVGFSNSSLNAFGDPSYVRTVYQNFLTLQQNATPFSITTGKRLLQNMLIEYIDEMTDERSENSLFLILGCKEALMASTQTVSTAQGLGQSSNQVIPQSTAAPVPNGTQQLNQTQNYNASGLSASGANQAFLN